MPATRTIRRPHRPALRLAACVAAAMLGLPGVLAAEQAAAPVASTLHPPPAGADAALPLRLQRDVARLEEAVDTDPRRVVDPSLEGYLHGVLCRLDPAGCAAVRVRVLREAGFNAGMAPGGLLVVRTGALLRCGDEAELALLLAHELAHARRGDAASRWQAREDGAGRRELAAAALDGERAADAAAIAMLAAAGYDVAAGERLWTRLLAEETPAATRSPIPRSHPLTAERLADFRAAVAALGREETAVPASPHGPAAAGEPAGPGRSDADRAGAAAPPGDDWPVPIARHRLDWLHEEALFGDPDATVRMLGFAVAASGTAADTFALGEALRRRESDGDRMRAAALYHAAIAMPGAPAGAWRESGLARLASGDPAGGRVALQRYLEASPEAGDAPFVEAMLRASSPGAEATGEAVPGPTSPSAERPSAPGPGGPELAVFDLRVRSSLPWRRQRGVAIEQWTIGGIEHDRLLIVPALRRGEPLFRDAGRTGPTHRPGRRPDEVRDRIALALQDAGWLAVRANGPHPHAFAGTPGWRTELSLASADGRPHRGTAIYAERGGRLTLLLWLAASGSVDARDADAVDAMFAGVRFAD